MRDDNNKIFYSFFYWIVTWSCFIDVYQLGSFYNIIDVHWRMKKKEEVANKKKLWLKNNRLSCLSLTHSLNWTLFLFLVRCCYSLNIFKKEPHSIRINTNIYKISWDCEMQCSSTHSFTHSRSINFYKRNKIILFFWMSYDMTEMDSLFLPFALTHSSGIKE